MTSPYTAVNEVRTTHTRSLREIADKIVAATEGDGELDRDIATALGWTPPAAGMPHWYDDKGNHWTALPDWSTSVDDALALLDRVKPNCDYGIDRDRGRYFATLYGAPAKGVSHSQAEGASHSLSILAALLAALISEASAESSS